MWSMFVAFLAQASVNACQDPNCQTCVITDGVETCLTCLNGLFPSGFQCVPCEHDIIECEPCGQNSWTCQCYSPLSTSECGSCPGDCEKCNNLSKCLVVPFGSYLDSFGTVQQCFENCLSCTNEVSCNKCKENYELIDGFCWFKGYKDCSNNVCKDCEEGYQRLNGNCAKIGAQCANDCNACYDEYSCFECKEGFYLEGNDCLPCSKNCLVCDNFGCNRCAEGFGVENGLCVPCTRGECPVRCRENCEECNGDLTCIRCAGRSDVIDTLVCYPKYCYLNCAVFGTQLCLRCNDGYYLDKVFGSEGCCKRLCKYPASVYSIDGTAIECKDGFVVVNGCCEPRCLHDNCLAVNIFGQCVKCPIGFILQNNCCIPYCCKKSSIHCTLYVQGYCVQCENGWTLINNCCHPKCPLALSQPYPFSIVTGNFIQECFACHWPSVDTPSGCCRFKCCKKSEDNCLAISIFGYCALCKPGWIINNYGCCVKKQCTVYPVGYFFHGEWCFKCPEGYYELDGCCFPKCCKISRDACKIWGTNGFCSLCFDGYVIGLHGCCIPKCPNNFLNSNWYKPGEGWCYKCFDGYTPIGYYEDPVTHKWRKSECCKPKCCPKSSALCLSYNYLGFCTSCAPGYFIGSKGCCIPKCDSPGVYEYIGFFWMLESNLATSVATKAPIGQVDIIPLIKYVCFACHPGYIWNPATNCCVKKFHCCNPPKIDTTGTYVCQTGYIFDPTTYCCKPICNNNCLVPLYSISKGTCYYCRKGCLSIAGTPCCKPICCSSSEVYCATRDTAGQCTSCSNGAQIPLDFPCCPININTPGHEHSIDYFPEYENFCTRLNPGSMWNTPLTCGPLCCPESLNHCSSFDKMGQCTGCKDGWVLNPKIPCCKPDNSYAVQYDSVQNNFCFVCPLGTVYKNLVGCISVCTTSDAHKCHCLTPNVQGTACSLCEPGWALTNGICVELCRNNHCLLYDRTNKCISPEPGYYVSASGCPAPFCGILDTYCTSKNSDSWCTACAAGFYLNPKGCCISNCPNGGCLEYEESGICSGKCGEGLEFNQYSKCCQPVCKFSACTKAVGGWCTLCPAGYNLIKGCCYPICDQSLFVPGSDQLCIDGYQYSYKTTCCIPKCAFEGLCALFRPDGSCYECLRGYRLDIGSSCCLPLCNENLCVKKMVDGTCYECLAGYAVNAIGCCELVNTKP